MKHIQYLEIFKKAGQITWKHKLFWWFGFFIFLGSFGGFAPEKNSSESANELRNELAVFFQNHTVLVIALILLLLAVALLLFLLRIISKAGLIKAVNDLGFYASRPFGFIFREGMKYLGELVLFEIMLALAIAGLLSILMVPIFFLLSLKAHVFAMIITFIAMAILLPILILAYFIHRYFYCYKVLGNTKLIEAAEAAYFLFSANIKASLLMGIFSLALGFLFATSLVLGIILLATALLALGAVPYFLFGKGVAMLLGALAGLMLVMLSLTALSAWEVFKQAAWVLFFQEITRPRTPEKKELEALEGKEPAKAGALG